MNWKIIIGALVGTILLRIFGFLSNTWLIPGFVILVWFWDFLLKSFTSQKKLINWVLGIFLAVSLISSVGLNIYQKYVKPSTPLTRAALERAKTEKDLEIALRLNPTLLKSRLEIASQLQILQDKFGVQDSRDLAALKNQPPEIALDKTIAILDSLKQNREKFERAMADLSQNQPAENSSSKSFSLPSLNQNMVTAGLIALIFLAIILCFIIKNRKARVALIYLAILSFISLTIWANVGHGPKNASASAGVQTTTTPPSSHQWSKVTYFDLNPGETVDTGIHYDQGDVINFYQPNDPPNVFYFVGQKTTTEIKEKSRTFCGLAPSGDIWLKAGPKPLQVAVSVHHRH